MSWPETRSRRTAFLAAILLTAWTPGAASAFEPGRAGLTVEVQGERIPYRVFAVFALAGETIRIGVKEAELRSPARLTASWGGFKGRQPGSWVGTAPREKGVYELAIESGSRRIDLNVVVMVPFSAISDGVLNGYTMGRYPGRPLRGLDAYRVPRGFVEVTSDNRDTRVSPHFTLGQFLCKQVDDYPKYVVLRERLLLKLESLLELANANGYPAETFFVMSGFRTPSYNAAIGNVRYSRHQWGDAADVFIDENPVDGVMDDLNKDGRSDVQDAIRLYELFDRESAARAADYEALRGGLGLYGTTASHGPFVHVDSRGFRARWGR